MSVSTNLGVKDAAMTRLQEPVEDLSPEKDGEAATLVADVRKAAKNLDAKNLEPSALGALDHTVARLAVIAKEREPYARLVPPNEAGNREAAPLRHLGLPDDLFDDDDSLPIQRGLPKTS